MTDGLQRAGKRLMQIGVGILIFGIAVYLAIVFVSTWGTDDPYRAEPIVPSAWIENLSVVTFSLSFFLIVTGVAVSVVALVGGNREQT